MKNYLELVKRVLDEGELRPDRTDVGESYAIWGAHLSFDLQKGFPILTSRKIALRLPFEETMFFLRGETDTKKLEEKNIKFWVGNTTRQFLDNRGLHHLPEGDMGKGYGYQYRNFFGVDQLLELVNSLKNDPNSRRHIISLWNPAQLNEMALPPCHLYQQYQILNGKLNSSFVMRSCDVMYGLPNNIVSYAMLNHMLAKLLNLEVGKLEFFGNDVHIYSNQVEIANELLSRETKTLPSLLINKDINTLDDMLNLEFTDLKLEGYDPHPDFKNKPPMAS